MNLRLILVATCIVTFGTFCCADIRVVKDAPPIVLDPSKEYVVYDRWCVSWALRDDTKPTMFGTCFDNLSEAKQYASRVLAKNHAVSRSGSWTRIKFVEIRGEASRRRKDGPTLPDFGDLLLKGISKTPDVVKTVSNVNLASQASKSPGHLLVSGIAKGVEPGGLGGPLSSYANNVADAYERAKALKEGMLTFTEDAINTEFDGINAAIDRYNNLLDNPPAGVNLNKELLNNIPRMTPVSSESVGQLKSWRKGSQLEQGLNLSKRELDIERARLLRERNEIARLTIEVDQEQKDLAALRDQVMLANPNDYYCPISGVTWNDCNHDDIKQQWVQRNARQRQEASTQQQALSIKKQQLTSRIEKYKDDNSKYLMRVNQYQQQRDELGSIAERIQQFAFERSVPRANPVATPRTNRVVTPQRTSSPSRPSNPRARPRIFRGRR